MSGIENILNQVFHLFATILVVGEENFKNPQSNIMIDTIQTFTEYQNEI